MYIIKNRNDNTYYMSGGRRDPMDAKVIKTYVSNRSNYEDLALHMEFKEAVRLMQDEILDPENWQIKMV